ncbi:MAG: hypothetical protein WCR46_19810 [Deltaproteobacteria bacterium]|jgi:hypothetical protein
MDKEFQQLVRDSEMVCRLADKLVRVHRRGTPHGSDTWFLEVISTRVSQIPENILKAISTIEDQNILKELLKKAVLTRSLEQFESEFQGYVNC